MTTTYSPKTLLRLYNTDDSYLCTAVVLKTGQILEVKNHDGLPKKTYDSFDIWKSSRGLDVKVKEDYTNASGSIVGIPDSNGFIDHCGMKYTQWILTIMNEGTPQLLTNPDVKNAFNTFTEILHKHREGLKPNGRVFSGYYKYYTYYLDFIASVPFGGFPVYAPVPAIVNTEEIKIAFKALLDLIKPDMLAYMKKKNNQIMAIRCLKENQKTIWKFQSKADKMERELNKIVLKIENLYKEKNKLENILKE